MSPSGPSRRIRVEPLNEAPVPTQLPLLTPATVTVPDLAHPILGIRAWRMRDQRLCSLYLDEAWVPGVNEAACDYDDAFHDGHSSPGPECECGLYAFHDLNRRQPEWLEDDVVIGTISAWGDVEVHRLGFRAESAQVIALGRIPAHASAVDAIGEGYRVPVVPMADLAAVSYEIARPLPDALRPRRQPIVLLLDISRSGRLVDLATVIRGCQEFITHLDLNAFSPDLVLCGDGTLVNFGADDEYTLRDLLERIVATGEPANWSAALRTVRGIAAFNSDPLPVVVMVLTSPIASDTVRSELRQTAAAGLAVHIVAPAELAEQLAAQGPATSVTGLPADEFAAALGRSAYWEPLRRGSAPEHEESPKPDSLRA